MLKAVSAENADAFDEERLGSLMNEKQRLTMQLEQYANARQKRESAKSRLDQIFTILDGMQNHPMEYDDQIVRQIIENVVVESKDEISVVFIGGLEVREQLTAWAFGITRRKRKNIFFIVLRQKENPCSC